MHNNRFRACLSVRHTFALSPNSSETAWNFKTPFYRMEAGRLRMVYVNFHKPICPRDFSVIADFSARISQKPLTV